MPTRGAVITLALEGRHGGASPAVRLAAQLVDLALAEAAVDGVSLDSASAALRAAGVEHAGRSTVDRIRRGERSPSVEQLAVLLEHAGPAAVARAAATLAGGIYVQRDVVGDAGVDRLLIAATADLGTVARALADGVITPREGREIVASCDAATRTIAGIRAQAHALVTGGAA